MGPAIASGSQTCSGTCALFPAAPSISSSVIAVTVAPPAARSPPHSRRCRRCRVVQRPEGLVEQEHRHEEPEVPDPVDDERLLPGVRLLAVGEPVADQQVAAETDALPADEHHRVARAHHQHEHEEDEEVQVREVARVAHVVPHVADAEDVDEEADARHHQHHDHRELVELDGGVDGQRAGDDPGPEWHHDRLVEVRRPHSLEVPQRQQEGEGHHPRADPGGKGVGEGPLAAREGVPFAPLPHSRGGLPGGPQREDAVQDETQQRQQDDPPGEQRLPPGGLPGERARARHGCGGGKHHHVTTSAG